MRKDNSARLLLQCPNCKKEVNEYNWTLETAAKFSIGEDTCPALIQVLIEDLNGNGSFFDGFRLICPFCHYGVNYEDINKPEREQILEYAEAVGEKYCEHWY